MAYTPLTREDQLANRLETCLVQKGFHKRLNTVYRDGDNYVARVPGLIPDYWAERLARATGAKEVEVRTNPLTGTTKLILIGVNHA